MFVSRRELPITGYQEAPEPGHSSNAGAEGIWKVLGDILVTWGLCEETRPSLAPGGGVGKD